MIKTMLALRPQLSNQEILSYFTRPDRDLNHRLIGQIADGAWPDILPAAIEPTLAYMARYLGQSLVASGFIEEEEPPSVPTRLAMLNVRWWPVGQGLFMSGRLEAKSGDRFNWVYDCGSSSGAKERDKAITRYRKQLGANSIDLLVLSHFDRDHINGIIALIKGLKVRTLLLPYVPLWQRLLIAAGQEVAEDEALFDFYVDPAGYLSGLEGVRIDEIVFVPGAGPDDVVPGPEDAPDPERGIEGAKPEYGPPPPGSEDDPAIAHAPSVSVHVLKPRGRILVPALWEFVPYNDASMQPHATATFIRRASWVAKFFLAHPARRKAALKTLKRIYQRAFGSGPVPANLISLFLYSGPIERRIAFETIAATAPIGNDRARDNLAQLATGDGYLDTPTRLNALRHVLSPARMDRAGLFQVMHHGARPNWHVGLAAVVKPAASIISSDPGYTHGHPDADVLRDFWPWHPVRVDKREGFEIVATLQIP